MRLLGLSLGIVSIMAMSACSMVDGVGRDAHAVGNWMSGLTTMETGKYPTGYHGHRQRSVFKPATAAISDPGAWTPVENFDGQGMPAAPADDIGADLSPIDGSTPAHAQARVMMAPRAVNVNDDVSVFPVDDSGEMAPYSPSYASSGFSSTPDSSTSSYMSYGDLVHRLYFAHGSSSIRSVDKRELHDFAGALKSKTAPVNVTIVGHASKRVDQTDDPIRKKMINFEMAQKRANTVTQELRKSGVSPDWVQTVSKGDDEPNPDPGAKSQEDADRRVELFMN